MLAFVTLDSMSDSMPRKGKIFGTFHFAGSTSCLVFSPGMKLEFDLHGQAKELGINAENIR
jgi:phosphatidylserine decarboxylase